MEIIMHRRNTLAELEATPAFCGAEMDIRTWNGELIVQHEPFAKGPFFAEWLDHFHHGTLILNVKEEGLEEKILELVRKRGVRNFFFLDQSFPFLLKTARAGERRCAVRVSEYESMETAMRLAPLIDWVWVDCFTRFPLEAGQAEALQAAGLKLCLVSPELEGFGREAVPAMRRKLEKFGVRAEAVCTKFPELWQ